MPVIDREPKKKDTTQPALSRRQIEEIEHHIKEMKETLDAVEAEIEKGEKAGGLTEYAINELAAEYHDFPRIVNVLKTQINGRNRDLEIKLDTLLRKKAGTERNLHSVNILNDNDDDDIGFGLKHKKLPVRIGGHIHYFI